MSRKFWNRKAEKYALSPIGDPASYERKLHETQALLQPDMRVLEFGCGTGSTAIEHAPHVAHIDALDISDKMLEIARSKAATAAVSNITFTRSTLLDFNAPADSVDVVLGLNILHLLPDRAATLSEVARILKPGGVFVSSTGCLGNSNFKYLKYAVPLGKLLGLMPDLYVISETGLLEELQAAGFGIQNHWHHGRGDIGVFVIAVKSSA